jgi:hypothetical protein
MKTLKEVLIVEGHYDQIKLQSIINATVIPTNGFRIFSDPEKKALLRRLAAEREHRIRRQAIAHGVLPQRLQCNRSEKRIGSLPDALQNRNARAHFVQFIAKCTHLAVSDRDPRHSRKGTHSLLRIFHPQNSQALFSDAEM